MDFWVIQTLNLKPSHRHNTVRSPASREKPDPRLLAGWCLPRALVFVSSLGTNLAGIATPATQMCDVGSRPPFVPSVEPSLRPGAPYF